MPNEQFIAILLRFPQQSVHIPFFHSSSTPPLIITPFYLQAAYFYVVFRQIYLFVFQKADTAVFQFPFITHKHVLINFPVNLHPIFVVAHSIINRVFFCQMPQQLKRHLIAGFFSVRSHHIPRHYNKIRPYPVYFRKQFFIPFSITLIVKIRQQKDICFFPEFIRMDMIVLPDKTVAVISNNRCHPGKQCPTHFYKHTSSPFSYFPFPHSQPPIQHYSVISYNIRKK